MSTLLEQASLVMIPSGYKEDIVYSQIPTNGNGDLTFTRASNGTRINSAGLVEVAPWNLIDNSQTFSSWAKVEIGQTVTVTDNFVTAPNGTLTGAKVVFSQFSSTAQIFANYSLSPTQNLTATLYAKVPSGTRQAYFGFYDGSGKVELKTLTTEWQRIEYTGSVTAGSIRACWFYGDGGASNVEVHLWGGQLNVGSTAKPYFPTTDRLNVPRLTYQNGGGGCPSLLLENQSTNEALYSNALSTTPNVVDSSTTTANVYVSPDGTQNAMRFTETTANDRHGFYQYTTVTAQTYTASIFTKQTGRRYIAFNSDFTTGVNLASFFDLQTISVVSSASGHTCSIQDFGNGWLRLIVTLTVTAPAAGSRYIIWGGSTNGSTYVYSGSTSISQTFYGYQLEASSYATSYIPTTSSSATRVADAFSRNNIYTNGLISASGGTWFVELRNNVSLVANNAPSGFWLGTSSTTPTSDGTIYFRQGGGSQRTNVWKYVSGTATPLYATTTDTTKIAIKWNGTTADIFENGVKVVSATAFTATNMEHLATLGVGRPFFIQQMALFPTPLSDAECQALTTI